VNTLPSRRHQPQHTVAELIAQLTHPDYRTRARAVVALGDTHDPVAIPALLNALSEYDRHRPTQRIAIYSCRFLA
jgi:HEAT repeat protein